MSHEPNWKEYGPPASGSQAQKDPTDVHDATYGEYSDEVDKVETPDRLPTVNFPVVNPPAPYSTK